MGDSVLKEDIKYHCLIIWSTLVNEKEMYD